ncbi:LAETG motif-containing sortase-dependent surface protein [Streptomyces griseosporeus]|uniref:LAETG motif-containing sortase-dependent surface protein n=1 Tax=Streptomyces griseosporeus TaxID=1910 RepID=UPI0037A0208B
MKLRRAMAVAAATAVIAPVALLSAPAAFATDGDTPTTTASTPAADENTPAADESTPAADESTPAADESTPAADESTPAADESTPAAAESTPAAGQSSPAASTSASPSPSASTSAKPGDDVPFDPYTDCKTFDLDEKLTASISGLPNKIVAGSGWHNFQFVVENNSDKDLKNVWIDAFAEYADETDASLYTDLAEIQVKEDGKWTDAYQDGIEDGSDSVNFSGSFVAVLDSLEKDTTATLDLRIKVSAKAPAGSAIALSEAVYAGENSTCYGNGDYYDVKILAAGSKPGDVDDAKPNGEKPNGPDQDKKPQGGVKEISGNLAETGSSSALPVIGLVGGVAVVAGAGAMFVVRRRKAGVQA